MGPVASKSSAESPDCTEHSPVTWTILFRRLYGAGGTRGGKDFSVDFMANPSESAGVWSKAMTSAAESHTLLEK